MPYTDVAMNDNTSTSLQTSAARLISLIFQPMLTATYLLLVVSVIATDSMREAAFWGFLAVTVSTGGPALDLRRRVRSGGITDFSIALREQRLGPLLVAEGFTALALGLLLALGGPQELATTLLVGLVSGGLLTAITTKWKISFHSGSLAGALTILIWFLGGWALLLIPALPAVGWSRVHMKKHTVTQVLAGAVAATALAAVVLGTLQ